MVNLANTPLPVQSADRRPVTFVLWKWHQDGYRFNYTSDHVNIMSAMLTRCCSVPHRVICITDDPVGVKCETFQLWDDHSQLRNASGAHLPSCYRRLKLFDTKTQESLGCVFDDRVCSIDLDAIVLQDIATLVQRKEPFVGWVVPGHRH